MNHPLEPSGEEMRKMLEVAGDFLIQMVQDLPEAPASDLDGADDVARSLRADAPREGTSLEDLLGVIDRAAEKSFNTAGPGFMAYIPGGGLFAAALADLIADVVNRYVGMRAPSPALVELEWNVVRWLCALFEYPPEARGVLTSGGSMANFSAVVTARRAMLPEDFLAGCLYLTAFSHHSMTKGATIAGFPPRSVHVVPHAQDLSMDPQAPRELIKRDRDEGLLPFMIVGTSGTTDTGAIDPIDDLASICQEEGLWFAHRRRLRGFLSTDRARKGGVSRD